MLSVGQPGMYWRTIFLFSLKNLKQPVIYGVGGGTTTTTTTPANCSSGNLGAFRGEGTHITDSVQADLSHLPKKGVTNKTHH